MVVGRGVSVLGALVANGLLLAGLLVWGWSIWTAVAALWLELGVETPFLARRIDRALGSLRPDELATYLRPYEGELDVHAPDFPLERLRRIFVGDPPATTARAAARHFAFFWVPFLAFSGLFLAALGWIIGARAQPDAPFLAQLPFDGPGLLAVAVGVLFAELVTAWLDRRAPPSMPDTSGYERRFVLIVLIVVLAGWVLGLIGPASRLIATAFVLMKSVADLKTGYLPQRFDAV